MGRDERRNPQAEKPIMLGSLLDRHGRPIVEGGHLEHQSVLPAVYKVERIVPIMDESIVGPRNLGKFYRVELSAKMNVIVPIQQPIEIFTMVRYPDPTALTDTDIDHPTLDPLETQSPGDAAAWAETNANGAPRPSAANSTNPTTAPPGLVQRATTALRSIFGPRADG